MKLATSVITILLSLNSLAQATPTPLTQEEKVAAYTRLSQFVPQGQFKGNTVTDGEEGNLLQSRHCSALYSNLEPGISTALYERRLLTPEAFTADGYHAKPIGITYMSASDQIIEANFSDSRASITAVEKTNGTLENLTIQKFGDNRALFTVTYIKTDGTKKTAGCNVNFNKPYKN